ncbi:hypothetical protein HDV02_003864 [Globomyces sp. JEL0801]|nr:hypothetical protein HDV02_003864 [Globomyces sp. JEL0801]
MGLVTVNADYEIEFNLTINALTPSWGNILHFTKSNNNMLNNGDRIPGVWLYPNAAKLLVAQDFDTQANVATPMGATISMGEPHYIKIVAVGQKIRTYVDNVLYSTLTNSNPRTKGVANVYIGDPWHTPADAWISKVYYNPCPTPFKYLEPSNTCDVVNVFPGSTAIEQNTLLGSVNVLGDYAIEFDLTINGIVDGWANILHLTQSGKNLGTVGDRIPGIWLFPGKSKIYVSQDTITGINQGYAEPDVKSLDIGKKYHVKVLSSHRQLEVYVDDALYARKLLIGATPTGTAQLFMSDNWHTPANAIISQVTYDPCPDVIPLLTPKDTCDTIPLELPSSSLQQGYYLGQINVRSNYEIEFDMVINGVTNDWGSIMHFSLTGNNYGVVGDRVPGIWLYPKSTMIHIPQDAGTTINQHRNPGKELELNKLYHVTVRSVGSTVKIYLNDNWYYTHTLIGEKPTGIAHLFASDPWYAPANVLISNIVYNPCPSGPKPIVPSLTCDLVTLLKEPSQLENANLLGNIYVHNHYAITFDLVINGVVPSWGSILHITQDGNNDKVGDRIPGIWLYPGDTKLLVSQDSFTSRNQFGTPGVSLDIGKLYMIRVEIVDQTVTVFVNSNVYYQRTISGDRPNGYAKVFVADPWHTPANAIISNVYYSPQKCVRMCIA